MMEIPKAVQCDGWKHLREAQVKPQQMLPRVTAPATACRLLAALLLAAACTGESPARLVITHDTVFLNRADRGSTIRVYTGNTLPADTTATPAVLGQLEALKSTIRFVPRFPAVPGQQYFVRATARDTTIDTTFTVPYKPTAPTTIVEAIYPSAGVVPMNLLRIYIQFSAPMRIGESTTRVKLIDDAGAEVKDAFLMSPQELWDPERQRLTMLFDPGRIKRDLRPHEELGLPLQQGRTYRVVVDSAWPDAYGNPLKASYSKQFKVGPENRSLPRIADWKVTAPTTTTPLTIDFPEPLDHALLLRMITVKGVAGHVILERNETRWIFRPDQPWKPGEYIIEVDTSLEDLAGNNLRDVFDVDRTAPRRGETAERISIPFRVTN